jgi:prepilin-type N-terminal cleavage/methylation domain-containing protein
MNANNKKKITGFTLIELMIVVVIIGILAAMALPRYMRVATKSKQSEAKGLLKQIYTMQAAYYAEHETYCLNGGQASPTLLDGFSTIGVSITPPARYTYDMVSNANSFTCTATANLDADATVDTWTITQGGTLVNTIDDSDD